MFPHLWLSRACLRQATSSASPAGQQSCLLLPPIPLAQKSVCLLRGLLWALQVVRTALVDAASVSSLMMTSEAIVVESPEEKAPAAGPPGGMGMGGGYGDMY